MTTQRKDPAIAQTIMDQIGRPTFFMVNAKNFLDHGNGLSFRIQCRGTKANYVEILLAGDDTYTVKIVKIGRAPSYKIVERCNVEGIHVDGLHDLIAEHTGLAVRMPVVHGL